MICSSEWITRRWQRQVDLDRPPFATEVVQHVEQPKVAAVAELVMHEVHRPAFVNWARHRQRLGAFAHQAFLRLDPQVRLQLAEDQVDTLVFPAMALDVAQANLLCHLKIIAELMPCSRHSSRTAVPPWPA